MLSAARLLLLRMEPFLATVAFAAIQSTSSATGVSFSSDLRDAPAFKVVSGLAKKRRAKVRESPTTNGGLKAFFSSVVDCGNLSTPISGYQEGALTTFGSVITFSCEPCCEIKHGSKQRVCQADGTWSGNQPRCSGLLYTAFA